MRLLATVLLLALAGSGAAAAPVPQEAANPEMLHLFTEDQADRKDGLRIDWNAVRPRDEARRAATRKLLADGALHTGQDYVEAAFIFQHGSTEDDYLLAHTLAMVAAAKGDPGALWIGAATLDRYLATIGKPQIYGTQYSVARPSRTWTQDPYARDLISDALRKELGVPTLAEQARKLGEMPALPAAPPK